MLSVTQNISGDLTRVQQDLAHSLNAFASVGLAEAYPLSMEL